MKERRVRLGVAALAFASAGATFILGLSGRVSPWLAVLPATLVLLAVGFFLADDSAGSDRGD